MDYRYDAETGLFWWTRRKQGRQMDRPAGAVNGDGYVCLLVEGRKVQAHRLAWKLYYGVWPEKELDHINRKRNDNRITNLREVTGKQNQRNAAEHKDKKNALPRHVDFRDGGYRVRVTSRGRQVARQGFLDLETALRWRDEKLAETKDD